MADADVVWTVRRCLEWTLGYLAKHDDSNPRLSAQWLLAQATGLERIELYMQYDKPLSAEERAALRGLVQRRISGEPLQYISGRAAFRYLELTVRPGVLIPRPETELLVELVKARQPLRVLEIGCGSGAISLALLHELAAVSVLATDISAEAVALTRENAVNLGLLAAADDDPGNQEPGDSAAFDSKERFRVIQDDLATSLLGQPVLQASFDVLVANPPYIPSAELAGLPIEVRDFEPRLALDGGIDGLEVFRGILGQAHALLKPGGGLAVELHQDTLAAAAALTQAAGFRSVELHTDLTGRHRFLTAEL